MKKYRLEPVIHILFNDQSLCEVRYVIQKRIYFFFWTTITPEMPNKETMVYICKEMNKENSYCISCS